MGVSTKTSEARDDIESGSVDGRRAASKASDAAAPSLPKRLLSVLDASPIPFEIAFPNGSTRTFGVGEPQFGVSLHNRAAIKAVASLNETRVGEAYLRGDIDFTGDLLRMFEFRSQFADSGPLVYVWRFLEPLVFGQIRTNKRAIASHYDIDADFFMSFLDPKVPSYTQGVFVRDDETLEAATLRKFEHCFDSLQLKPGDHILDIGPGWGGFLEFASTRGVTCSGITISQASADYLNQKGASLGYNWDIILADLLTYKTNVKYDAIVIMGVMEHLPQYDVVVRQFAALVKPGGRIFLDASADVKKYVVATFLAKYIYPGNHSYLVLHDFLEHLATTPLRLLDLHNDRHSYYLTAREWARNLDRNAQFVTTRFGVEKYRAFRLYLWGTAFAFLRGGLDCYRMVLWHANNR